jgi:hypothetical protein
LGLDHGETETAKLLVKHNPAKSLAWLDKYAAEAFISKDEKEISRFGDRSNPLLHDLQVLKKKKVKAGDLGKALPPFQPSEVFRYLDAPKTLDDFGDRKRAEVDKVYVHQVLRAIKALVQSGRCREPWIGKLLQLTKHTDPEVRQAAFLAFADFGNELDPKNSPIDDFRKVMDDAKETAAIRESALMAFSSISHPQVYVRLHELALETDHPAWPAAISRLNDIGDEFTLEHLNRLDKTKLPAKNAAILEKTRGDLKKWVEDPQRGRDVSHGSVARRLERAAWAEYTKSPVQKTLTPWTKSFFVNQPDDAFVENLEKVQKEYEPTYSAPDPKALTHLVRALAMTILNTPKPQEK